jgi:hypothetical protein
MNDEVMLNFVCMHVGWLVVKRMISLLSLNKL